jgi:hypothetical protein
VQSSHLRLIDLWSTSRSFFAAESLSESRLSRPLLAKDNPVDAKSSLSRALSRSLSHSHTRSLSLSLSLSFARPLSLTHTLTLSPSLPLSLSLSLALSLARTSRSFLAAASLSEVVPAFAFRLYG